MNPMWAAINPYWAWIRLGGLALLVAGAMWYADTRRAGIERADCLAKENKVLQQAIADNAKANEERRAAQAKADRLAKLPPKVKEVIRANPSGCSIAKPVAGALRDQVKSTNDAIRSR